MILLKMKLASIKIQVYTIIHDFLHIVKLDDSENDVIQVMVI